mgnify:CR=1 FL=1
MASFNINGNPMSIDLRGTMEITEGSPADTYLISLLEHSTLNLDMGQRDPIEWALKNTPQPPLNGLYSGATLTGSIKLGAHSTETIRLLDLLSDQGAAAVCSKPLYETVVLKWYDCDGTTLKLTVTMSNVFVNKPAVVRAANGMDFIDFELRTMTKPTTAFANPS